MENIAALKGAFSNDDKQVEMLGKHLGIDFSSEFAKEKKLSAERNDQGLRQGVAGLEQVSVLMMKTFGSCSVSSDIFLVETTPLELCMSIPFMLMTDQAKFIYI